jgi:hypothetical protein
MLNSSRGGGGDGHEDGDGDGEGDGAGDWNGDGDADGDGVGNETDRLAASCALGIGFRGSVTPDLSSSAMV